MEDTVTAIDRALVATRDAMHRAEALCVEAHVEAVRCHARIDELLERRNRCQHPLLPSNAAPGQVA